MIKNQISITILLTTVFVVLGYGIMAQTKNYSLKLAEAYEKDGQFEEAVEIYEKLILSDSLNPKIISGLKNGYKILARHEKRAELIRIQLKKDSSDIILLGEMVDVYYRLKNIEQARHFLNRALSGQNRTIANYQAMGRMLFELRWFEESLRVYQQARIHLKNDQLFILEIAGLLLYQEQYLSATQEYLKHYKINPGQWGYIKNQLYMLPDDTAANRQVIKGLSDFIKKESGDINVSRALLDFYIRSRMYERAFELAVSLDRYEKQNGISILNFAQAMIEQNQFSLSVNAYRYFLSLYPNAPQAEAGLARCYIEMADSVSQKFRISEQDTLRHRLVSQFTGESVQLYKNIIKKYPDTEWAIEAAYQTGLIYLNRYHDYDKATQLFSLIRDRYPKSLWYSLATLQSVECMIRQNKIHQALKFCLENKTAIKDYQLRDQLTYITGELYLYESNPDTALSIFRSIAEKQQGFFVNNALQEILLIQQGKQAGGDFDVFIKARLLFRQFKHNESVELLTSLTEKSSPMGDQIRYQLAVALVDMNKYEEALYWLKDIKNIADSPLIDLSLKTTGDIYVKTGNEDRAVSIYKELIVNFPKSIYIGDARKAIRKIEQQNNKAF